MNCKFGNYNYAILLSKKIHLQDNYEIFCTKDKNSSFVFPLRDFLLLYILDINNYNNEYFSKQECDKITNLLKLLKENEENALEIKVTQLKEVLKETEIKRIPDELNKELCLELAKINNKYNEDNDMYKIDIDKLTTILESK